MRQEPRLHLVLATEWGNIRHLRWSPIDPKRGTEDVQTPDGPRIGLLGAISSDGHARLVAVSRYGSGDRVEKIALRIERAAVEITPPQDTVFTSLASARPTDLLLGTANGFVQIYDISELPTQGTALDSYMHYQHHHRSIMSLCPASGPRSTLVASTSACGELGLTDLRSPEQDRILLPRFHKSRTGPHALHPRLHRRSGPQWQWPTRP